MAYDNTNSGALFRNERRQSDKHPEYKGEVNVNGVDYWLSAWVKESKGGKKYFSLVLSPKEPRGEESQAPPAGMGDDVPF